MASRVTDWLEQLGLGQYAEPFVHNAITWEHLPDLDHETLLAVGVKAVGHDIKDCRRPAGSKLAQRHGGCPLDLDRPGTAKKGRVDGLNQ